MPRDPCCRYKPMDAKSNAAEIRRLPEHITQKVKLVGTLRGEIGRGSGLTIFVIINVVRSR